MKTQIPAALWLTRYRRGDTLSEAGIEAIRIVLTQLEQAPRADVRELRGVADAAGDALIAEDFGAVSHFQRGYAQAVRDLASWLAGDAERTRLLELVIEGPEEYRA